MSDIAIRVEGLGKRYRMGQRERYKTLRDTVTHAVSSPFRWVRALAASRARSGEKDRSDSFWALKDVSFDVPRGSIVGVIGRNGAGKSTLLKVLSRITEPTEGRAKIYGRVGSLLDVGTGFHPELTGRENIFLNGAILGMHRVEVLRKFDEIVAFAEIDKFLDTPVKRYSSGMYVRLAFAVAAHLEPDILVVDEVLAVGDVQFQKKCLGKIGAVGTDGRTVLFVSHVISSVLKLCSRGILIDGGRLSFDGDVKTTVHKYASTASQLTDETVDVSGAPRPLDSLGRARIISALSGLTPELGPWQYPYQGPIAFKVVIHVSAPLDGFCFGVALYASTGWEIASSLSSHNFTVGRVYPGDHVLSISYSPFGLIPGFYRLGFSIRSASGFEDYTDSAVTIEVVANEEAGRHRVETFGGAIVPKVSYALECI